MLLTLVNNSSTFGYLSPSRFCKAHSALSCQKWEPPSLVRQTLPLLDNLGAGITSCNAARSCWDAETWTVPLVEIQLHVLKFSQSSKIMPPALFSIPFWMILSFLLTGTIAFRGVATVTLRYLSWNLRATAELSSRYGRFQLCFPTFIALPLSTLKLICHFSVHSFFWGPVDLQPVSLHKRLKSWPCSLLTCLAPCPFCSSVFLMPLLPFPPCWINGKSLLSFFLFSSHNLDTTLLTSIPEPSGLCFFPRL